MHHKLVFLAALLFLSIASFAPKSKSNFKELICVMPICTGNSSSADDVLLDRLIDFKLSDYLSKRYTQVSYLEVLSHCNNADFCTNSFWNGYDIKKNLKLSGYVSVLMVDSANYNHYNIVIRGKRLWKTLKLTYSKSNTKNKVANDICKEVSMVYNNARE